MTPRELVLAQFPGRLSIPLVEAGAAIGLAEQTCYNLRTKQKFPLRVHMEGRKAMVALTELVRYLEARTAAPAANELNMPTVKRRVGRPRNSERVAA